MATSRRPKSYLMVIVISTSIEDINDVIWDGLIVTVHVTLIQLFLDGSVLGQSVYDSLDLSEVRLIQLGTVIGIQVVRLQKKIPFWLNLITAKRSQIIRQKLQAINYQQKCQYLNYSDLLIFTLSYAQHLQGIINWSFQRICSLNIIQLKQSMLFILLIRLNQTRNR